MLAPRSVLRGLESVRHRGETVGGDQHTTEVSDCFRLGRFVLRRPPRPKHPLSMETIERFRAGLPSASLLRLTSPWTDVLVSPSLWN